MTTLFLALAVAGFASRQPGYDHSRHTISELGELGAPLAQLVSWGVFLPVGLSNDR